MAEEKEIVIAVDVQKLALTGVGAAAATQSGVATLAEKCIEEGAVVEKKGRDRAAKFVDQRKKGIKRNRIKVRRRFNKRMGSFLNWFNIPSHNEVQALNRKIGRLSKKIEELKEIQAA